MKIGLQIPSFTWPGGDATIGPTLRDIAQAAEANGFASLWVMDHFFQLEPGLGAADEPMLEGYSTLGFLAGVTERIKLGLMVTGANYRKPGLLVKQMTTVDVLSRGRAYFGVGAGWYEREALGLDLPFPPLKTRFEWLEETLQIAHQMWKGDRSPYNGQHFQLAEPISSPQPVSRPHPPILVGGSGEKKTLRMVAQYADACNIFVGDDLDHLTHKLTVLDNHCRNLSRDPAEIERTTLGTVHVEEGASSAADMRDYCTRLAGRGVQHAIFNMPNVHDISPLETIGREVIPALEAA